jgi:hypothetical protein
VRLSNITNLIKAKQQKDRLLKAFEKEFLRFKKLDSTKKLSLEWKDIYPCLEDKTTDTPFDAHYIYHPAWATRIIKKINPTKHIDISSTLHFCSTISAFYPTEFYDYRPAPLALSGLISGKADLTDLFFESDSIECLTCMHTIEHIGLGRYGDPLDPEGDTKAINELKRVTKVGGNLLIVTPVGIPRIKFNAHRIYSYEIIINLFSGFELLDFSIVDDEGKFIMNADPKIVPDLSYGCGCFWFRKI